MYAFTTIFFIFGWQGTHVGFGENDNEFSYFTTLTWWGIAFYFLIAAVHTLIYACTNRAPLDCWPRPLLALHSLLYTTVVTYPFLVTIVYWALLNDGSFKASTYSAWRNVKLVLYSQQQE